MIYKLAEYSGEWTIYNIFSCKNCEETCCRMPYIEGIVPERDGVCVYLHDGLCSIYPERPEECRIFPFYANLERNKVVVYATDEFCTGKPTLTPPSKASREELSNFLDELYILLNDLVSKGLIK